MEERVLDIYRKSNDFQSTDNSETVLITHKKSFYILEAGFGLILIICYLFSYYINVIEELHIGPFIVLILITLFGLITATYKFRISKIRITDELIQNKNTTIQWPDVVDLRLIQRSHSGVINSKREILIVSSESESLEIMLGELNMKPKEVIHLMKSKYGGIN